MKTISTFLIGMLTMFVIMSVGPFVIRMRAASDVTRAKVEDVGEDYCRARYLQETQCFQRRSSEACDEELKKACGK